MMKWPARQSKYEPSDEALVLQAQFAKALMALTPADGIGMALAYLLLMADEQPLMLQRTLVEPMIKEGFRGVSMIEILNRICK